MYILPAVFRACLLWLSLCTRYVFSESSTQSTEGVTCPRHQGSDPNDANERVRKFASVDEYYTEDEDYQYKLRISDWLMIKYFNGDKYGHHCVGLARLAVVLITCDPGEQRGSVRVIEEYRNKTVTGNPLECYYLFELNHAAACTVTAKQLSPGSIMLIILIVVGAVYLLLGFLYQDTWLARKDWNKYRTIAFGETLEDGCNFMCRCSESRPTRYKTMDDALADDDRDDTCCRCRDFNLEIDLCMDMQLWLVCTVRNSPKNSKPQRSHPVVQHIMPCCITALQRRRLIPNRLLAPGGHMTYMYTSPSNKIMGCQNMKLPKLALQ
ncbi:mannose-6-phosphate receptor [Desmophyllum pertusum]|uniref:Mannose-6-phosphate receptor n=1 Tax=Desmophyllum pertusum TaxID=174260 RepID=A0A9X0A4S1_9CNID|nr:mannose-6-phosphate receptor [Desmophyllum pertusum]